MSLVDELDKYENGKYVRVVELREAMEGRKLVQKNEFMAVLEQNIGFCNPEERIHTFADFSFDEQKEVYYCRECNSEIDIGRYEAGQTIEMFLFDKSWIAAKREASDNSDQ